MNTKKFLPLAIAGILASGFTASAQASVVASSILDITNFKLTYTNTGTALNNLTDLTVQAGNNFGTLSAQLTSHGAAVTSNNPTNDVLSSSGGQFDGTPAVVGNIAGVTTTAITPASLAAINPPGALGNNNFGTLNINGVPPTNHFAYADNLVQGATIDLHVGPGGSIFIPAGVTAETRADVSLIGQDAGTSTATTGTNTTELFKASVDASVTLSFDYYAEALAYVSADSRSGSNATAGVSWNWDLQDLNTGLSVLTSAQTNPTQLNLSASRTDISAQFNTTDDKVRSGSIAETFSLTAGHTYQFTVNHQVQSNAHMVPEPGTLAILGLGIFAMAFAAPARGRRSSPMAM